jgi:uncharacterized membrane protein
MSEALNSLTAIHLKEERVRFVMAVLLASYLVGRILQLFAGQVPDILIVALHVIPPLLFAYVHGARVYASRGILAFTILCLAVATFFELIGLRTGFPFGHYKFTELIGPAVFGLPIMLALAYVGMGYLGSRSRNPPTPESSVFRQEPCLLPVLASLVMTAWDLSVGAVWTAIDHRWVWRDGADTMGCRLAISLDGV